MLTSVAMLFVTRGKLQIALAQVGKACLLEFHVGFNSSIANFVYFSTHPMLYSKVKSVCTQLHIQLKVLTFVLLSSRVEVLD